MGNLIQGESVRIDEPTRITGDDVYQPRYFSVPEQVAHWVNEIRRREFLLWELSLKAQIDGGVELTQVQAVEYQILEVERRCRDRFGLVDPRAGPPEAAPDAPDAPSLCPDG